MRSWLMATSSTMFHLVDLERTRVLIQVEPADRERDLQLTRLAYRARSSNCASWSRNETYSGSKLPDDGAEGFFLAEISHYRRFVEPIGSRTRIESNR